MDKDSLGRLLAEGRTVEQIAQLFGKDPSVVSHWMAEYGLDSTSRSKHAARGGIPRERLEELVEHGRSIAQIAQDVGFSKTAAVRYWLGRYGLRTMRTRPGRIAQARAARDDGTAIVVMSCHRHGETEFTIEGRGYYRCRRCRADRVTDRRRRTKAILVDEAGGRCIFCGYDRYVGALQFHHVDRSSKRLALSSTGATLSIDACARRRVSASCCARTVTRKSRADAPFYRYSCTERPPWPMHHNLG